MSGPVAAALFLTLVPLLGPGLRAGAEGLVIVVGIIILDRAHTFATFWRVFGIPQERQRFARPLTVLAVAIFTVFFAVHVLSRDVFWSLATYLTVWHVLRQHAGFAVYAEDRSRPLSPGFERFMAPLPLYLLWAGTLLSLHVRENHTLGWYSASELVKLPDFFMPVATGLAVAGVWCYVSFTAWRLWRKRSFSYANALVWLSSLAGSLLLWVQDPAENRAVLILSLSVLHSIPYLAATHLVAERSLWPNRWVEAVKPRNVPVGMMFIFVTLVSGTLWQIVGYSALQRAGIQQGSASSFVSAFGETLFMLPVFVHNVADGWLWRRRKNPEALAPFDNTPTTSPLLRESHELGCEARAGRTAA